MKLRRKQTDLTETTGETSLILFCANYKKDKLEKVRRKYEKRNCLKCVRKAINKKRSQSSTPLIKSRSESKQLPSVATPDLFYSTLSPISQRHNTMERVRRENVVRKNLLEKSLQAIIAEAKRELEDETKSNISSTDYMSMNANNNSNLTKNQNLDAEDYVEDEVYEEILFQRQPNENFYEPVNFNIYEPISFQ